MGFFKKDPLQIIAFQSYGTDSHLYIRGRALEDEQIDLADKGFFSLLTNSWKRFSTDELAHTRIKIKLSDGSIFYTETDDKGYFKLKETHKGLRDLTNDEGWLAVELSFDPLITNRVISNDNRFPGEVAIPSENGMFGVISDIDDTILHTGLTSALKWQVLKNTFLKRAEKRTPLEGAAEFYHQLHRGKSGIDANPVYYVSHSPWNLYRYLEYFLKKNNFPKGPLLLRNFSSPFRKKIQAEKPQKQTEIIDILNTYPKLPFILIGDSGEHDPDIYIEIAEAFPDRILAIYLRSVRHKKKMIRVEGLTQDYNKVPVLLVEKSKQAIEHAREHGFIQ
ncbi:uncharacterized protein DUF2183 [Ulvibacter sp. MAR_2010_11]|uniref:App1 family protein n=1 Tax=Ulvibacter sp. MAR_2010_11 TaxID=1250229 RepID=UPI000C2BE5AC|nr:phosphatase domain-containing protein [Ulvibacter sp. MAR_2010_11]PKA83344.1 uncharacterized protein DUF2183 [Ulvibacter sp. MAR_2010_11]